MTTVKTNKLTTLWY